MHIFQERGITVQYERAWGRITQATVQLEYNEQGKPEFTDSSLLDLRDFLFQQSALAITFNLPVYQREERESFTLEQHLHESLGKKLSAMVKSLPSVRHVTVQSFSHGDAPISAQTQQTLREVFQWNFTPDLRNAVGHPTVKFHVKERDGQDRVYEEPYDDTRSWQVKMRNGCLLTPLLGRFVLCCQQCGSDQFRAAFQAVHLNPILTVPSHGFEPGTNTDGSDEESAHSYHTFVDGHTRRESTSPLLVGTTRAHAPGY